MTNTNSNSIIASIAIRIVETDLLLAVKLIPFRWNRAEHNNREELHRKQNKQWNVKTNNIAKQGLTKINMFDTNKNYSVEVVHKL